MINKMRDFMCKKDGGGLSQLLVEGGLAIVGIALLVVVAVASKPILEGFIDTCGQKAQAIFTMF